MTSLRPIWWKREIRPPGADRPASSEPGLAERLIGRQVRMLGDTDLDSRRLWTISELKTLGDNLPYAILRHRGDQKAIALSAVMDTRIYEIL